MSLLEWFKSEGGFISEKLTVQSLDNGEGIALVGKEPIEKSEVLMLIPYSCCMTIETAVANSGLSEIVEQNSWLMDAPDELLALHLMIERGKGERSRWAKFIETLPSDVDTPIHWTEAQLVLLGQSMCRKISSMLADRLEKDYEELYVPLKAAWPSLLERITFDDYRWALSSIWSRAFSRETPEGSVQRCMVPVLNAANHCPTAAPSLAEIVCYDAERQSFVLTAFNEHPGEGKEFYILYGHYCNAKLLHTYGFTLAHNPVNATDLWVQIPPTDPRAQEKRAMLDHYPPTAGPQTYDFTGTLRSEEGGEVAVSSALLATARVVLATEDELRKGQTIRAFPGVMISVRNERAVYSNLAAICRRRATSLFDGTPPNWEQTAEGLVQDEMNESEKSGSEGEPEGVYHRRRRMAAHVIIDERDLLLQAAGGFDEQLRQLELEGEQFVPADAMD